MKIALRFKKMFLWMFGHDENWTRGWASHAEESSFKQAVAHRERLSLYLGPMV